MWIWIYNKYDSLTATSKIILDELTWRQNQLIYNPINQLNRRVSIIMDRCYNKTQQITI